MKKFDIKSIVLGIVIGTMGAYGASAMPTVKEIKSATDLNSKVYFYEKEVPLKSPLIAIEREGNDNIQVYMPVRELLEYMQFNVQWKSEDKSVHLTMNNNMSNNNMISPVVGNMDEIDAKAISIIQKTGNWSYIEPYLPKLSPETIRKVVEIYNSKHQNPSEHKKASDYITE
ncbi:MAG: stalk domain-containing protein [Anaeromicrobium sp.]|uniref:stalk domain-containing protein n=1 Tax=Anaeromicrobium sp. TaxID=1929132 RepID=UPI0025F35583|nr:stalk domain-containing protein [Anaeromicrobium sp.]MCT4595873.1 stalk domain-containing protein [Anaeromicrobium sp.]